VPAVPSFTVENRTSSGMPTNEWLVVTASATASGTLMLTQGGATLATLPVTAVALSALGGLALGLEPTDGKHGTPVDGDRHRGALLALALARRRLVI